MFKINSYVMKMSKTISIALAFFWLNSVLNAHPTGNMIVVDDYVLWPYVCPVNDSGHHACVMIWREGNEPEVLMRSNHTSSDFMLYQRNEQIYIMERRYHASSQNNEFRILKSSIDGTPAEFWPWTEFNMRIGEGGFFMLSDEEMVFCSYPNIYLVEKGGTPKVLFDFDQPVKRLRALGDERILLLGEGKAWLTTRSGEVIKEWDHLLMDEVTNAPLNRNQIFDIDYQGGELLLANWGNRSFDVIHSNGQREIIIKFEEPIATHWLAYFGELKVLFASHFIMDGSNPKPHLLIQDIDQGIKKIWTIDD